MVLSSKESYLDMTKKEAPAASKVKPMGMFLQDPTVPDLHQDFPFPLDRDFLVGTGSSKFIIRDANENDVPLFNGLDWATADLSFARFAGTELVDNLQFHQVNTFAVLSHTLAFVEKELGHEIVWDSNGPLVVRPHAFEGENAYYYPLPPSLNFGYFTSPFRRAPVWTCLSHDVVTHELGHAILDNLRPLFIYTADKDTNALHESFGDLIAMFSALEHPEVVSHIYAETGGDMHHRSLLTNLAEEFGVGLFGSGEPYLRSALEGPAYDPDFPKEAHARSTIWTAAMYELLSRLVAQAAPKKGKFADFAQFSAALAEAVNWVRGMLLRALHYTAPTSLSMPTLARLIYEADARVFPDDANFREIAQAVFKERKLWDEGLLFDAPDIGSQVKAVRRLGPAALSRLVMQHAGELRIPPLPGLRLLEPRIVTTTRNSDKVEVGGESVVQQIVEHYLEYTFEQIELTSDFATDELVAVAMYGGGTLVMNEDWETQLLITSPEARAEEEDGDAPAGESRALRAWKRARNRFMQHNRSGIRANLAARGQSQSLLNKPVVPGCSMLLRADETGAYRIMRRACNLKEHVNSIRFMDFVKLNDD